MTRLLAFLAGAAAGAWIARPRRERVPELTFTFHADDFASPAAGLADMWPELRKNVGNVYAHRIVPNPRSIFARREAERASGGPPPNLPAPPLTYKEALRGVLATRTPVVSWGERPDTSPRLHVYDPGTRGCRRCGCALGSEAGRAFCPSVVS